MRTDGKVENYDKPRIEEDGLAKIWKEYPR
jgi:hypothetical protein